MITIRLDGGCRADIKTEIAADLATARVRANTVVIDDINRFFKLADKIADVEHGFSNGTGLAGVHMKIAIAALGRRQYWRIPGHIKYQTAL